MTALIWLSLLKARHAATIAARSSEQASRINVEICLVTTNAQRPNGRPNISAKGAMSFEYLGSLPAG